MLKRIPLSTSVCIAALLTASAATADLSAADVWADWQGMMSVYGQDSLTFTEDRNSGGVVEIDDLSLSLSVEADDVNVALNMGSLTFTEQGDGTVKVTMPDSYPMTVTNSKGEGVDLMIMQSGLQVIASGTPADTNYAVAADRYGIIVDEFRVPEGEPIGDMRFMLNNVTGNYTVKTGEMRDVSYAVNTGSADILMDLTDPETNGTFLISGKMNDLNVDATASLPLEFDAEKPEQMFVDGLTGAGQYSFSSADYIFDVNDSGDTAQGSISMGVGSFKGGLSPDQLAYETSVQDVDFNLTTPDLPFPVNVSVAEYGIGIVMPLGMSEEPKDLGLKIAMLDLAVNDEIWMMGDPTGALPHDPLTLNLDLAGTAKLFFDLMDPTQQDALNSGAVPGELHSLTLNDLTLRAAGAEVTGTGAFTFDNSDLQSFDGLPRPLGEVTVNVNGANKLIDSLVGMGLLPEDQAMMGRMMMGMFARTVGDDQLSSTLVVNEQGHVVANGQRIK